MGGEASKQQLKDSNKSKQAEPHKHKRSRRQENLNKIESSRKTELSHGFQQLTDQQSNENHSSQANLHKKLNPQKISSSKSQSKLNNQKIKCAIKQSQNEPMLKSQSIFKKKSNPLKQQDLFEKSRLILGLNEAQAHDLKRIKKVYPQLAKMNKNDPQKLIQLNQAFLFLRVLYFKTQFGTTAVYQNDKPQVYEKHYDVLDLSSEDAMNIMSVKGNFSSKMRIYRLNKTKRIELNMAFEYLANKIFKAQKSVQQIKLIDAVIVCDKETLIQMFVQNKQLINYRQTGSDYPLLYIAVRSGHYEIVQLILRMGCTKNFSNDRNTPLHCAAFYEHKQILELLLSYGLPHNVRNSFGVLPIDDANSDEVKKILQNVNTDEVQELILKLKEQKISLACINIKDSSGDLMARKILLKNYLQEYNDHVDAFHGTTFQALESIAKHGLRKPGSIVDGKEIKVAAGHIGQERLEITQVEEKKDTWADAIFLSESYNYASCPCYSKDNHTINHITGRNEQWAPVVQTKLKKGSYTSHQSTTDEHEMLFNEPFDLEFRVEDSKNIAVVAIILIRRQYMREKCNKNYLKTTELILNSREETQFRQDLEQKKLKKFKYVVGKIDDNPYDSLINFLTSQGLFKTSTNIYSKNRTIVGRKIGLQSQVKDGIQYVTAYHSTDYNSLRLLKKYGIKHLLNERKQFFVSPNLFNHSDINELPRLKTVNQSTHEKEQWAIFLQVKVHQSIFLESKRSKDFISNWKDLSNFKFRIKSEFLEATDFRIFTSGLIFVNLKFITSEDRYKLIVNQIQ